jgi:hypothetical protein
MTALLVQIDGNLAKTAEFYLLRTNGGQLICVKYISGSYQSILVHNGIASIFDNKTKKKYDFQISQTPIFSVLSGKLDLTKEKYEILEDSRELLRIKVIGSSVFGGVDVTLVFSKYEETGNIQKLVAWIIDDGTSEILVSLDPDSIRLNCEIQETVFTPPF